MATAPSITLPVKADTAPVIAVIEVIVRHLTALRDDLAALSPERRGVRYWVIMADDLIADYGASLGLAEAGIRIVELGGRRDQFSRHVLVEDDGAPPELEGKHVELTLRREGDGPAVVASREVTG